MGDDRVIKVIEGPSIHRHVVAEFSHQRWHGVSLVDRHPPIAVLGDARKRECARSADQYAQPSALGRLGATPHRWELDHLAVELGNLVAPDLAHREHAFANPFPAVLEYHAIVGHFLGTPATADA